MKYIRGVTTNDDPFMLEVNSIECFEGISDGPIIGVRIVMKSGASFRTTTYDFLGLKDALEI